MKPIILSNSEVGTHSGNITKYAGEEISTKYLLGAFGESGDKVRICQATDSPIGVITDEAAKAGDPVNVALLGGHDTIKAIAAGTIAAGDKLTPAADGEVASLANATEGSHLMVGVALTSASATGQVIEFMSCVPQQYNK